MQQHEINEDTLWLRQPASRVGEEWKTAFPLGNGTTGALVCGAAGDETILLTRSDLWTGAGRNMPLPDLSGALADMRHKIDSGDYPGARDEMMNALRSSGYTETLAEPFPLGSLVIRALDISSPFTFYRRGLQMDTAEVFSEWNYGEHRSSRTAFVSASDGALWLKLRDEQPRRLELMLGVRKTSSADTHPVEQQLRSTEKISVHKDTLVYTAGIEGRTVGAALRVFPIGEARVRPQAGSLILVGNNFDVQLVTFVCSDEAAARKYVKNNLAPGCAAADAGPGDAAFEKHLKVWKPRFEEVTLKLGSGHRNHSSERLLEEASETEASAELCEKLWKYARYLFLSGTSPRPFPFALYGMWPGDYDLPWAQNVGNENVQMIYAAALPGGCFSAMKALILYYSEKMDAFRENAKKLFGCRGIFVPAYTAPGTVGGVDTSGPSVPVPVILNWISCAGWLASGFYAYYLYTKDEKLLADCIFPFMAETCRFYADYVKTDADGRCRIYPSVSPENTPGNLMPKNFTENMTHACPTVENATMDMAVMKETLGNTLRLMSVPACASRTDAGEAQKWRQLLDRIPAYQLTKDGAIREWMAAGLEEHPHHRHVSHLYPVFPGNEVRRDNAPELLAACKKAAENRVLGSKSGWSFAHMSALWARTGEAEKAMGELDLLCKTCLLENFFTLHNDWRHMGGSLDLGDFSPVQLDALMGTANALYEMLLRGTPDRLIVLPALPARFSRVSLHGVCIPQGRADLDLHDGALRVGILANTDENLTVETPDGEYDLHLKAGKRTVLRCTANRGKA